MANFIFPDWATPPEPPAPPPPDPVVAREQRIADNTRAEEGLNRFMTAKQDALFNAPDAYYLTQGADAIRAAPVILGNLGQLKDESLDGLANDNQRRKLGAAIDAHLDLARDDIARHVAEQSQAWQRQSALDRIAALAKEAALHHNDDGLVDAIGNAAATAARAHARVGNPLPDSDAEDAAAVKARSGVLGAAIRARLDAGNLQNASALLDRTNDQLDPEHAALLQARLDTLRRFDAAKTYASQLVPATPAASADEIEAQRTAATQQAAADHADDPQQGMLAQHFIDVAFDGRRNSLDKADADRAAAVHNWLNAPSAAGKPQTGLPPPALWNSFRPDEQDQLLARLRENGRPPEVRSPEVMSDATPEPIEPGQQYAQAGSGSGRPPNRPRGGSPADPLTEIRAANFQSHLDAIRELEPNNQELSYIAPKNWIPTAGDLARVHEELLRVRQRFAQEHYPTRSAIPVGEYAGESIPGRSSDRNFTTAERTEINRIGAETGCHTCGTRYPGTLSGNFILDHQPASSLNPPGGIQRLYPQCLSCSLRQGGQISGQGRKEESP